MPRLVRVVWKEHRFDGVDVFPSGNTRNAPMFEQMSLDCTESTRAVHHDRTSESGQEDKGKNRLDLAVVGDLGRTPRTGPLSDWML